MRVFSLSIHSRWRCLSSLACCSAGWVIPVESEISVGLRRGLNAGALDLSRSRARAEDVRSLDSGPLPCDEQGRCLFLERERLCSIHRCLGSAALPQACRQFPRVAVLEARGVSLSLTHFCPSAAALLFDSPEPLSVVENPPAFPEHERYEGLETRGAFAPLLRPGVLLDPESRELFESRALELLANEASAEAAIERLERIALRASRWSSAWGSLARWIDDSFTRPESTGSSASGWAELQSERALRRLAEAEDCVPRAHTLPSGLSPREPPLTAREISESDRRFVHAAWPSFSRPVRRWLATRLHASWVQWQGDGLRPWIHSLGLGLDLLRLRAAGLCARRERPLDRSLLLEAIRAVDLLLMQRADPEALARLCNRVPD